MNIQSKYTSHYDIQQRLRELANISLDDTQAGSPVHNFREIQEALFRVHKGKANQYGDYLSTSLADRPTDGVVLAQILMEIKRKWTRVNEIINSAIESGKLPSDLLLENLGDLSNFGVLGISLLLAIEERAERGEDVPA